MNVLVTGATGFVGSHVVDVLLERGHTVSFIARSTSNMRWLEGKPVQRVDGSLFDLHSLQSAVEGVDVIIHVAGLTAAKNEAEFLRGNRDATQNLMDAVRTYRPGLRRFVHISSLAVSGPSPDLEHPITEEAPYRPLTAYGRTKQLAENIVKEATEIPWTIIRPPAVYGPRDSAIFTFFQTVDKGLATFIGFDEKKLSLVHVRDLARGIVDAAFAAQAEGQTYFISSDEFYTWREIAELTGTFLGKRRLLRVRLPHALVLGIAGISGFVGRVIGKPSVLDYEKGIDIIQKYWTCSTAKAHRELGYRQEMSLKEGLRDTIEWYRKHKWL
ncbi:MAG: NAD-dependent epimerase/dehydratase family protein [Candidatus Kapabacteria bacterium]|nr:NAD-dependent epimerase/dehydratase family protein [Candidatus Kapabacteria bacterium]